MVLLSLLARDETTCWRRLGEKVPRVSTHAAEELEWSRRWVVRACIAIYFYSHVALVHGLSGVRIRGGETSDFPVAEAPDIEVKSP